jgi:hypothetical protein
MLPNTVLFGYCPELVEITARQLDHTFFEVDSCVLDQRLRNWLLQQICYCLLKNVFERWLDDC